jgi:signal transduction histidine kinase
MQAVKVEVSASETSIAEARMIALRGQTETVIVTGQLMFSNLRLGIAFMQDATGGIAFLPKPKQRLIAGNGAWVKVTGVVMEKRGMMTLVKDATTQEPPEMELASEEETRRMKPLQTTLEEAVATGLDTVFTHVTGTVRRVYASDEDLAQTTAEISTPGGHAVVKLPWSTTAAEMESWLNVPVSCYAMLVTRADTSLLPRDAKAVLFVPGKMSWNVRHEELTKYFEAKPLHAFSELLQLPFVALEDRRALLSGIVTAAKSGAWVSLRLKDRDVQVFTRQTMTFQPGDHVSAACVMEGRRDKLFFLDGICRFLSHKTAPEPEYLAASSADGALVRMRGVLRDESAAGGGRVLHLLPDQGPGAVIDWHSFIAAREMASLKNGSVVEVTGLLNASDHPSASRAEQTTITPRSLADLRLLRGPAWWTRARLQYAVWGLLGLLLMAAGAGVWLWRRARQESERLRTVTVDERRRIAGEFHDTVHQQLSGAALHLETLKGAVKAAPEMMNRLIDDAATMIRHCQLEARYCIWDLHSEKSREENLAEALEDWLKMRSRRAQEAEIHFQFHGTLPPLDAGLSHHIMRIAQESVNNALSHAAAKHIRLNLAASSEEITLEVADDGTGYDVDAAMQPGRGNFGIITQQQRARKIGATLRFDSHPGRGTRVMLRAPVRQTSRRHATATF